MAILLFCEGTCKKQMGSLEPFIVHEDKYMCIKCAPKTDNIGAWTCEVNGLWTAYEQINQALGLAHWQLQFTPDRSKGLRPVEGFSSDSYIWWNRMDKEKSRALEIFVNGNWIFWKCDLSCNWSHDTAGNIQQARSNIEWIIANWSHS